MRCIVLRLLPVYSLRALNRRQLQMNLTHLISNSVGCIVRSVKEEINDSHESAQECYRNRRFALCRIRPPCEYERRAPLHQDQFHVTSSVGAGAFSPSALAVGCCLAGLTLKPESKRRGERGEPPALKLLYAISSLTCSSTKSTPASTPRRRSSHSSASIGTASLSQRWPR